MTRENTDASGVWRETADASGRVHAAPLHEGEREPVAWLYTENKWKDGPRHRLSIKRQGVSDEDANEFEITETPLYAAPPPSAPRMLVDQSWLDRRVEKEPDGLDCEVVPSVEVERLREALEKIASGLPGTRAVHRLTEAQQIARAALSRKQEPGVPTPGGEG